MKSLIVSILVVLSLTCSAQKEQKTLAYITSKGDTVIVDTVGFIRYLMQEIDDLEGAVKLQREDMKRLKDTIRSIQMIMFWKPKEDERFTL